MKIRKWIRPEPIYPRFVLEDRVKLYDQVGFEFYIPESDRCKTLKEGDFVKVLAYPQYWRGHKDKTLGGQLWLRVETVLPKYEMYIGRVMDTNFIDAVLDSEIQYIPFFERNIADIFQPDVDLLANSTIEQILDGQK